MLLDIYIPSRQFGHPRDSWVVGYWVQLVKRDWKIIDHEQSRGAEISGVFRRVLSSMDSIEKWSPHPRFRTLYPRHHAGLPRVKIRFDMDMSKSVSVESVR